MLLLHCFYLPTLCSSTLLQFFYFKLSASVGPCQAAWLGETYDDDDDRETLRGYSGYIREGFHIRIAGGQMMHAS